MPVTRRWCVCPATHVSSSVDCPSAAVRTQALAAWEASHQPDVMSQLMEEHRAMCAQLEQVCGQGLRCAAALGAVWQL
jgi:hypothetical protein